MPLDRFSAAWREAYVSGSDARDNARDDTACVFCELLAEGVSESSGVLVITEHSFSVLNAFPYGSGHVLVLPRLHVSKLNELSKKQYADFAELLRTVSSAVEAAYGPDGLNVGMNLGQAAGAGIPKHLHAHVLPRWNGDTNFMTTIGETRVLPESLQSTWQKVHDQL